MPKCAICKTGKTVMLTSKRNDTKGYEMKRFFKCQDCGSTYSTVERLFTDELLIENTDVNNRKRQVSANYFNRLALKGEILEASQDYNIMYTVLNKLLNDIEFQLIQYFSNNAAEIIPKKIYQDIILENLKAVSEKVFVRYIVLFVAERAKELLDIDL